MRKAINIIVAQCRFISGYLILTGRPMIQQQKLKTENSKRKTLEFLTFALLSAIRAADLVFSSNLPYVKGLYFVVLFPFY